MPKAKNIACKNLLFSDVRAYLIHLSSACSFPHHMLTYAFITDLTNLYRAFLKKTFKTVQFGTDEIDSL